MYYTYIPSSTAICQVCSQPSLKTCGVCNTSFICQGDQCQKPIIVNNYSDNKILYNLLKIMGSLKTMKPCPEHTTGGTETSQSFRSLGSFSPSVSTTSD